MPHLGDLEGHLRTLGRVLLGYSGGVDSTLLAVTATRALPPGDFLAVIGRSASYPEVQYRQALAVAARFGVPVREVTTGELDDPRYVANAPNRCYFCKSELWSVLGRLAREESFDVIIDGTIADDLGEHRPGLGAAAEHAVRSPLAELAWSKQDVREAARALGIPVWDAPAAPCLSSRIRYGVAVTPERLSQVEAAEAFIRGLGVRGDLRVRHLGDRANVEAAPDELDLVRERWGDIAARLLELGFAGVALDPRGYRRGAMLEVLAPS